ncbi:MAG: AI-2E family transporter [Alphaproteobacteria bacterium]
MATGGPGVRPIFSIASWFVVVALTLAALVVGQNFLIPLAVALIVWYLINGIARGVKRLGFGRVNIPDWLCLTLSVLLIVAFSILVGNLVSNNISAVAESAPVYEENFQQLMIKVAGWFGLNEVPTVSSLFRSLNLGELLTALAGSVSIFIADAGLVLIYVLFLLFEQTVFDRKLKRFMHSPDREEHVRTALARITKEIEAYIWIKTVTSAMTAIISYAVLVMVGVDFAAFWGLLIFLLAYIPTIGSLLGIVFPALLTLLQFGELEPFLIVAIPLALTQIIIGNVIEPRMMGRSLNLSPLVVMASLVLWSMLWGVPGAFLCVPITVIFMIVCTYVPTLRPVAVLLSTDGTLEATPRPPGVASRAARPSTGPAAHGTSHPPGNNQPTNGS